MNQKVRSLVIGAVVSALCSAAAYAGVKITNVTNDWSATNGCTVRSAGGYGGYYFNVTVWGVDCPNDPEVSTEKHETWSDWGGLWCEMQTHQTGYYLTGNCGYYGIFRN